MSLRGKHIESEVRSSQTESSYRRMRWQRFSKAYVISLLIVGSFQVVVSFQVVGATVQRIHDD